MESLIPETREVSPAAMAWDSVPHGESWECAVLWGSLVLEAAPGCVKYRLPAASTWSSTMLRLLPDDDLQRQAAVVRPRWVN